MRKGKSSVNETLADCATWRRRGQNTHGRNWEGKKSIKKTARKNSRIYGGIQDSEMSKNPATGEEKRQVIANL
jgi:hypothetical protein